MPDATTPVSTGDAEGRGVTDVCGRGVVGTVLELTVGVGSGDGWGLRMPLWATANAIAMTAIATTTATTPRIIRKANGFQSCGDILDARSQPGVPGPVEQPDA
jgi:hypothetical protein